VKQDLEAQTLEVAQAQYFVAAGKKFADGIEKYGTTRKIETPLPEGFKMAEPTPEEIEEGAKAGLKLRDLVGTLAYPSAYTRLDIRREVAELSRYLHKPTIANYKLAVRVLQYCIATKDI
jgi:hypothetical protein